MSTTWWMGLDLEHGRKNFAGKTPDIVALGAAVLDEKGEQAFDDLFVPCYVPGVTRIHPDCRKEFYDTTEVKGVPLLDVCTYEGDHKLETRAQVDMYLAATFQRWYSRLWAAAYKANATVRIVSDFPGLDISEVNRVLRASGYNRLEYHPLTDKYLGNQIDVDWLMIGMRLGMEQKVEEATHDNVAFFTKRGILPAKCPREHDHQPQNDAFVMAWHALHLLNYKSKSNE